MMLIEDTLASSFLLWLGLACLLRLNKALRAKRGALSQLLCLDDLNILALVSLAVCFSLANAASFGYFLLGVLCLYAFLVFLDAVLFIQYRIEINRQTLAWFFTGSKGLAKGVPYLLEAFNKFYYAKYLLPLLFVLVIATSTQNTFYLSIISLSLVLISLHGIGKLAKPVVNNLILLLIGTTAVLISLYGQSVFKHYLLLIESLLSQLALAGTFTLVLISIARNLFASAHRFLTTPSLLPNIILNDNFKLDSQIEIKEEHKRAIENLTKMQIKSTLFSQCKQANIIMITMESLGAYISPDKTDMAHSILAEKLAKKSWLSKQHFSLCPNTTVSTNQIYTGNYSNNPYNKDDSDFFGHEPQHIETLKKNGYKTLFLDSANIGLYDYWKLLNRIGFDKIWGTDDIPANGLKADYRLLNMIEPLVKEIDDSPFFLHLINDQTHMPYEVVDKERFNRHKGSSPKSLYLNAVEEVDYIIDTFLTRLADKIDLSNTIIVFTGDHGESFGEYGYSFHSNSVIQEQVQVPFMLSHPALEAKTIAHSCHFDLFPTFFDLLGIEYDYQCVGQSLAFDDREKVYFFHSATLKGNTPANFSLMFDEQLFWVDRLFSQAYTLNAVKGQWKIDKKAEESYCNQLLATALSNKTLIKEL